MRPCYDQDLQLHSSSLLALLSLVSSPGLLSSGAPEVVSPDPPLASNGMIFVPEAMLFGVTGGITFGTAVFTSPSSSMSAGILRATVLVQIMPM